MMLHLVKILVDGNNIRNVTLDSLRKQMGVMLTRYIYFFRNYIRQYTIWKIRCDR